MKYLVKLNKKELEKKQKQNCDQISDHCFDECFRYDAADCGSSGFIVDQCVYDYDDCRNWDDCNKDGGSLPD